MKTKVSDTTRNEAMAVAKATQKPGQTKEQTRLIAQGVEKGIAEYKKQQKAKARERDKARKLELKQKAIVDTVPEEQAQTQSGARLPWILLGLSWAGFFGVYFASH